MSVGTCARCGSIDTVEPHMPWWAYLFGPLGFILFGSLLCVACKGRK
jgi:hypothetical protein